MNSSIKEKIDTGYKYEDGIWKGPKVVLPKNYYKYGERLLQCMRENSKLVGQVDAITGKEDTFEEITDRSIRCAVWLKKQNIKKGDIIAISSGNHMNVITTVMASLFNGSIFNPWWPFWDEDDLIRYFMELTNAKVIFATEKIARKIEKIFQGTSIKIKFVIYGKLEGHKSFDEILAEQTVEEVANFKPENIKNPEDPAYLMYVAGSKGQAKAVLFPYRSLGTFQAFIPRELMEKSTGFSFSNIAFASGVINSLKAIEAGSKMIIFDDIPESEAYELIEKYEVNWITMVIGIGSKMSKNPFFIDKKIPSVKYICMSGAAVWEKLNEFLKKAFPSANIFSAYGTTELGGAVTLREEKHHPESIGRPIKNVEIKVVSLNDNAKILGPNEQGEFYIKSPSMMTGYFKNPEATSEVIDADGWYYTQDYGYYNENGEFFITDKMKELIKTRYCHLAPAPIEKVIQGHPGVQEVAVVAKPNNDDVDQPMAFIVKISGAEVTEQEIIDLIDEKMPARYKLRGGVKFIDKLPRTNFATVEKHVLRQMAAKIAKEEQTYK